jgi:hypothetical protein
MLSRSLCLVGLFADESNKQKSACEGMMTRAKVSTCANPIFTLLVARLPNPKSRRLR